MNQHTHEPSMTTPSLQKDNPPTPVKGQKMFGLWYGKTLVSKHKAESVAIAKGLKLYKNPQFFFVGPLHKGPQT